MIHCYKSSQFGYIVGYIAEVCVCVCVEQWRKIFITQKVGGGSGEAMDHWIT